MNVFSQYNKGNVLIIGAVNTGKTSILNKLIEECIENKERIHFIDGESELSNAYSNNDDILSSIVFTTKPKKMSDYLKQINPGDTIIVDSFYLFPNNVSRIIEKYFESKKYRFIICVNNPKECIPYYKFDNVINLRTGYNYSNFIGYDSSNLELGRAIINKKNIVEYPVEEWMQDKLNKMK